jgi:hypothetical protein
MFITVNIIYNIKYSSQFTIWYKFSFLLLIQFLHPNHNIVTFLSQLSREYYDVFILMCSLSLRLTNHVDSLSAPEPLQAQFILIPAATLCERTLK